MSQSIFSQPVAKLSEISNSKNFQACILKQNCEAYSQDGRAGKHFAHLLPVKH